jgi:hypothetical protein
MISRSMPCFLFAFWAVLAFATAAFSQATFPTPTLTSLTPLGAQASTQIELTLRGTDLDAPIAILLNERSIPVKSPQPNVLSLALPTDLKLGLYDLRFVGRYGVSNPRAFEISRFDTIESYGSNTQANKAQKISLNTVIEGVFKSANPHWFLFDAKKGQTITATFHQRRFDTRTELLASISEPTGREVARLNRGVLSFTAAADATYRLRLNELMFRIGDEFSYHITLSTSALTTPPVSAPAAVRPIQIGQTIADTFPPFSAPHSFDLPFKKGERFFIEVHSHQLGYPTDAHLVIENLKPDGTLTPQAEAADAPAISPAPSLAVLNRDPSYAYEAKADGRFRLTLNDVFGTTHPYELRILKPSQQPPTLIAINPQLPGAKTKTAALGSSNIPRHGITALEVIAPNRHALSEPIELKAEHLPAGVSGLGGFIGRGQSLGYIAFQATADAPPGASVVSGISQSLFVSFAVPDMVKDSPLYRSSGPPAIGVSTLTAPAYVQPEKPDILQVAADSKLEIPLKVTRHAEFTEALKLKVLGLIADVTKAPEVDIAAKATAGKLTLDVKALKLAPGEYGFILQGPAKMKVRRGVEELTSADIAMKQAMQSQIDAKAQLARANADVTPKKAELIQAATAALKTADAAKNAGAALVKDLTAKAAPKEATFIVYSHPMRLRVQEVAKK